MRGPRLTRRSFFKTAAAGSVVAAAAIGVLSGCTHSGDEETSEPVVVDEDSAENIIDTFESVDLTLAEEGSWSLPLGNVLHPAEGTWIPVTTAGSSAIPMVKASALSLASGQMVEVVPEPVGKGATIVIYTTSAAPTTSSPGSSSTSSRAPGRSTPRPSRAASSAATP